MMEMESVYKLRSTLLGHSSDIRAVAATIVPENGIVTCSRDKLCMVWAPTSSSSSSSDITPSSCEELTSESGTSSVELYTRTVCLKGHNNYVSSVCVIPPSDEHQSGLIATGGHDKTIRMFHPVTGECVLLLEGHTSTVSALSAGKFGTLLSGSWDETAKVWLKTKCVMTLSGHTAAVWAVAIMPQQGCMLTGSADKTVRLWKAGKCEKIFKGHDDCVRGLAVLSATEFLSCSNDATIRRWDILHTSTQCVHVYYGHTNYVYSIAMLPNGIDFITCGEDRSVKIWENGENTQSITLPSQSVWSVCSLSNGDIVTATSDGKARIFTQYKSRIATDSDLKSFEAELANSTTTTEGTLGGVKISDLPGEEALLAPGNKDGQTKLIKCSDKTTAVVYQWSESESQWVNVGQAVGASGGTADTSGKTLYNGKEYDYVFTVDIEEGKPPLKLPYNTNEDPWLAAQKFLMDNDLSPQFLDQVAQFITQNSDGAYSSSNTSATQGSSTQSDPYTGGSRYIPGSAPAKQTTISYNGGQSDPLTGGSRYIPGVNNSTTTTTTTTDDSNPYFPVCKYVGFESSNTAGIIGKLKEFTNYVAADLMVKDEDWPIIECLTSTSTNSPIETVGFDVLRKLLKWPIDKLYPVLDILRLCIRNEHVSSVFTNPTDLHTLIQAGSFQTPIHNQMLITRILSNLFLSDPGKEFALQNSKPIIEHVTESLRESTNRHVRIGVSTILLNYAISPCKESCSFNEDVKLAIIIKIGEILSLETFPEAQFRLLVSLGSLMYHSSIYTASSQSLGIKNIVLKLTQLSEPVKLVQCATLVAELL